MSVRKGNAVQFTEKEHAIKVNIGAKLKIMNPSL